MFKGVFGFFVVRDVQGPPQIAFSTQTPRVSLFGARFCTGGAVVKMTARQTLVQPLRFNVRQWAAFRFAFGVFGGGGG